MTDYKPRLLIDFDGVIHAYSKGWADGTAYDRPMPDAKNALARLTKQGYEVVIFSTRRMEQIRDWLKRWDFPDYRITNIKEPAVAMIDDRAIRFLDWLQVMTDITKHYSISKDEEN